MKRLNCDDLILCNIYKTRELPGVALVNSAISRISTIISIKLIVQTVIFIPFSMHGRPSLLQPHLAGEGINRKSKSWKTTSFDHSMMENQHCNGRYATISARRRLLSKT